MLTNYRIATPDGQITIAYVQGKADFLQDISKAVQAGRFPKIYELPPVPCRTGSARARRYSKRNSHNLGVWKRRVKKLGRLEGNAKGSSAEAAGGVHNRTGGGDLPDSPQSPEEGLNQSS
jgi:hypothetical protein